MKKLLNSLWRSVSLSHAAENPKAMSAAKAIASAFYLVLPFLAFIFLQMWDRVPGTQGFHAIWPLAWSEGMGLESIADAVRMLFMATAILGAAFYRHRWARILAFIGIWQAHALESSLGNPNHQMYGLLYVSLFFIFLPNIWKHAESKLKDWKFLLVVWWAQAFVLLTYTMSGIGKWIGVFKQMAAGDVHGLHPLAFAYQVADWLPKIQADPPFGPAVIAHPYLAWPFYFGIHFILLFAILAAWKPAFQKPVAFILVLFHIGTYLVMGIIFPYSILLLCILFFDSPFAIENKKQ